IDARSADPEGRCNVGIRDMMFSNIRIDSTRPVRIEIEPDVEIAHLSGLSFTNIRATGRDPILIKGSSRTIIEDIRFDNVCIETLAGQAFILENCRNVILNKVCASSTSKVEQSAEDSVPKMKARNFKERQTCPK
nr:hypothetical protein [Victivallales bacterium]